VRGRHHDVFHPSENGPVLVGEAETEEPPGEYELVVHAAGYPLRDRPKDYLGGQKT
jgi:hypothetical protein